MTKIELDDVLKIINKEFLSFDSSRAYYKMVDEIKQLAGKKEYRGYTINPLEDKNNNSTKGLKNNVQLYSNKRRADEALGLGDAVNHVQQNEAPSQEHNNVCKNCGTIKANHPFETWIVKDRHWLKCNKFEPKEVKK